MSIFAGQCFNYLQPLKNFTIYLVRFFFATKLKKVCRN